MSRPKWFVNPRPNAAAPLRLFCFPYAGGGASVFRAWSNDLPEGLELCALQLPGRESRIREAPFTAVAPLVQALSEAILPWLDRPYAIFGHSMGALVGFELVRALLGVGAPAPEALFLSGRRAPRAVHEARETPLHLLTDDDLQRELLGMDGMDPAIAGNANLMSLLLPTFRADFSVCETHTPSFGPELSVPIIAFGGDRDGSVAPAQLAAWALETCAESRMHVFSGSHFYFRHVWHQFVQVLSSELRPLIASAGASLPRAPRRIGAVR